MLFTVSCLQGTVKESGLKEADYSRDDIEQLGKDSGPAPFSEKGPGAAPW